MLDPIYTQFVGRPINDVELHIRATFGGEVVVLRPTDGVIFEQDMSRLQVYVDDANLITKIVNG